MLARAVCALAMVSRVRDLRWVTCTKKTARQAVGNPGNCSVRELLIGIEEALGVARKARGDCVGRWGVACLRQRQRVVAADEDVLDAAVLDGLASGSR